MPTLLLALDGSRYADAALPVAVGLARQLRADLELVSVIDSDPWRYATGGARYADRRLERDHEAPWRDAVRRHLEYWRDRIAALPNAPVVRVALLEGAVADSLSAYAAEIAASLLVVTTHGRSGLELAWIGSTTDALIRRSSVPVIAVRPSEDTAGLQPDLDPLTVRRVLVPLDGSSTAEAVLAPLRERFGDAVEYLLMRAVSPLHPMLRAVVSGEESERDMVQQRELVVSYLREAEARLRADGLRASHCAHVDFEPHRGITDCARSFGVDLIALATHGRGPAARALLGSVADKVLRTADRPVLIYRAAESTPA
jgi:nucleotide-binding universal stress UspA family protein